ncbi:MAG: NUDIX hydrolase [Patescibacteria group bacterium]
MENRKHFFVVLGAVVNSDGAILVSQRFDPAVSTAHLKWDFPGGKNEFGESLEETVVREIKEETGLGVSVKSLLPLTTSRTWHHTEYSMHTVVICYLCDLISGELSNNDPKINELKWVELKDAKSLTFLPTTKPFIDHISGDKRENSHIDSRVN